MSVNRIDKMKSLCIVCLVAASLLPVWAQAQEGAEARIIAVHPTTDVAVVRSTFNSLETRRLPKFSPEGRSVKQAVLVVDWQTARALPAGSQVRFSYRQAGSDDVVKQLEERHARPVTGRQRARFAVPQLDPAADRVTAWRVQIVQGGRVLDERFSAAWR